MDSKPSPKAPLFVFLSWFAPLFMWHLRDCFDKMKWDFFSRHNSEFYNIIVRTYPVIDLRTSAQVWLDHMMMRYELASFNALVSSLIFGLIYPLVAYWRREPVWWLSIPPFVFYFSALVLILILEAHGHGSMGYNYLFPSYPYPPY